MHQTPRSPRIHRLVNERWLSRTHREKGVFFGDGHGPEMAGIVLLNPRNRPVPAVIGTGCGPPRNTASEICSLTVMGYRHNGA